MGKGMMSMLKRVYEPGVAYFITTVTQGRRKIFVDRWACEVLITVISYQKLQYGYKIFGFVIMPDHIHLVIQPEVDQDISKIMKDIKGSFARLYNKRCDSHRSIWQNGFFDRALRDYDELIKTIQYMHANPMRKRMIASIEDYEYSSYRFYEYEDPRFGVLLDHMP